MYNWGAEWEESTRNIKKHNSLGQYCELHKSNINKVLGTSKWRKKIPTVHWNMYHMYSTQWIETLQGDQLLKGDVI